MGATSIWHWMILVVVVLGWAVPIWKILRRLGFSGWWVLVACIPLVNILALWLLAWSRWPNGPQPSNR